MSPRETHYDGIVETCRQAVKSGGEFLGCYMTEDGRVDLYVTTTRPENMTEICERLRLPLPLRC